MVDFIILGILLEQPMSAYDMTKVVDMRNMSRWVKISHPAIYKNAPRLLDKGFLTGERGESGKILYSVTGEGREYFLQLANMFSAGPCRFDFPFTPVLMNLALVDGEQGKEMIGNIRASLRQELHTILGAMEHLPPMKESSMKIVEMYKDILSYLNRWIDDYDHIYEKENEDENLS